MELTQKFVKSKRPCADGYRWFIRHRERGSDYQQLLDALVRDGRVEDACWLLSQFGPTDAVLTLDEVQAEALVFAGSLVVRGGIEVGTTVRAGRCITAGAGIRAGRAIVAGEDLRAGAGLHSEGLIAAGGRMRVDWHVDAAEGVRCAEQLRVGWDLRCDTLEAGGAVVVGNALVVRVDAACSLGLRVGEDIEIGESLRAGQGVRPARTSVVAAICTLAGACAPVATSLRAARSRPAKAWWRAARFAPAAATACTRGWTFPCRPGRPAPGCARGPCHKACAAAGGTQKPPALLARASGAGQYRPLPSSLGSANSAHPSGPARRTAHLPARTAARPSARRPVARLHGAR
jgi:hypothetical protein